jgi:flagellar hook-associated protein 3 FlgL
MTNRITSTTSSRLMLSDIMDAQRALTRSQRRISSGKDLQRGSDDPAKAVAAMDQRQTLARSSQHQRNALDARGWLTAADSALISSVDDLTHARTLVVQARNGNLDATGRAAIATELRAVRERLLQAANTRYLGRPVFNGTAVGTSAYDSSGTYLGDAGAVVRPIGPVISVQVNWTGAQVFGSTDAVPMDGDVFQVLDAVAAAVTSGDVAAMGTGLDRLEGATRTIQESLVEVGARMRMVEDVNAQSAQRDLDHRQMLAELEDTDMAQAVIDVKARQFTYEAALGMTGRILGTSLLDHLR